MHVQTATAQDRDQILMLAAEVEHLFGPMVAQPEFLAGLDRVLRSGEVFCVRGEDAGPGGALQGAIMVSREANALLWFAVAGSARGGGLGRALLERALDELEPGQPVTVQTFDAAHPEGAPARRLYQSCGFRDLRPGDPTPAGVPTVHMVRDPR